MSIVIDIIMIRTNIIELALLLIIKMQYINVSQFYQSILCFSIPLLLIQRLILCCCDLSTQYEDYRMMFYDQQFQFTKEYDTPQENNSTLPPQSGIKQDMLDRRDQIHDEQKADKQVQIDRANHQNHEQNRSRVSSITVEMEPSFDGSPLRQSVKKSADLEPKKKIKVDLDLETDRQLKSGVVSASPSTKQIQQQPISIGSKSAQKQKGSDDGESKEMQIKKIQDEQVRMEEIEESRMSRLTHSDIEVRRETQLDEDMQKPPTVTGEEEEKPKRIIELGRGTLLEKGEKDKIKLKYCRRVDDAFNDYIPIIMSLVVLGICTQSVYIYSMCCFFGYAFSSLLFNYVHLLDRLQGGHEKTFFGRANQLISSLFIIGLFISYWVSTQFY